MSARVFRNIAFISGVLAVIVVFGITGQVKQRMEREHRNKGFFESIGSELSGQSDAEISNINQMAGYNRILLGGAGICFIVGIAACFAIDD